MKVKVKVKKWKSEVVEYICDVDDQDFKKNSCYGISDISTLGDMSNGGGDASGMICDVVSEKTLGDIDYPDEKYEIISWRELPDYPCDEKDVCNTYAEKEDCDCDDFENISRVKSDAEKMLEQSMEQLTNLNTFLNDIASKGGK